LLRKLKIAVAIVSGLVSASPLAAQYAVNPRTYESPSRAYALEMDPSQLYGEGAARYRLTHQGQEVWSGERPFTLLDAGVGDDGVVAGYSYGGGRGDWGPRAATDDALHRPATDDAVHLLILDPRGKVRLDDVTPRRTSHSEASVRGFVFDPDNDRVMFGIGTYGSLDVWKTYRLSTGEPGGPFQPVPGTAAPNETFWIQDVRPLRGTPLTLVDWQSRADYRLKGARFTLADAAGRSVWALDLPKDFQTAPADGLANTRMSNIKTSILDASRSREFDIRVVATSERVSFKVEADEKGGFRVSETGRQPYADPQTSKLALESTPERPLRYLGPLKLAAKLRTIRSLHDFDIDDQGRAGFAHADPECNVIFGLAGLDDESRHEISLGRLGTQDCSRPLTAWAGGNMWLVTLHLAKADAGGAGWWVDADSGKLGSLSLPSGISVEGVAGKPGGGVVLLGEEAPSLMGAVLGTLFGEESRAVLLSMSARGEVDRGFSDAAHKGASKLDSPTDVAVTTSGDVLVTDAGQGAVVVFDSKGSLQTTIDLADAWSRPTNYLSAIAADVDGGFIVEHLGAAIPFVRMHADGSVRGGLQPRYEAGQPTGRLFRVRGGRDGAVWASHGDLLLRLGGEGVVERVVSDEADPDVLDSVAALALDSEDRIYAANGRSGAVHVFGADGTLLHVCHPDRGDVSGVLNHPDITVTRDGRVFMRVHGGPDTSAFLEFSSEGERVARHDWPDLSRLWNPATGGFWALHPHDVAVVDEQGRTTRTVARRADRHWLDKVLGAVVAPDGSIAVAAESPDSQHPFGGNEWNINLYSSAGAPIGMIRLPGHSLGSEAFAYDGRSIAVWHDSGVRVLDLNGKLVARFKPRPDADYKWPLWPLLLAAGGRELWVFDGARLTLHRFEMP
jgi:hypothetical protein